MREAAAPEARRSPWRRWAGTLFVTVAFIFLALYVASNLEALRAHRWSVRPGLLALSLALHVVGLWWGVYVWKLLLARLGIGVALVQLARVWFLSGLGRYIPGKIWQFVGAAHLGAAVGLPARVTVSSLVANTAFFLVGALLVSVYLLPAPIVELGGPLATVLPWLAPFALLLVHPAVIRFALSLASRATGGEAIAYRGGWLQGVGLVVLATIGWAITGFSLFLFIISLTPLASGAAPAIIGINALSFVIGYLVFVAPAGLGAKEGALAAMLSFFVPAPVAAVIAVAARLWTVSAEILPALVLLRIRAPGEPRPSDERATIL